MNMVDRLRFIRQGAETRRFHTVRTVHDETVAHHSHGVAMMCYLLTENRPSAALLMAALTHDLPEHVTGDIPSPTKRLLALQEFRDLEHRLTLSHGLESHLTPAEEVILSLADALDGAVTCCRERALGNTLVVVIFERYREYVDKLLLNSATSPVMLEVLDAVDQLWKEVTL